VDVRIPVRYLRRLHAAATIAWLLLVVPTVLWWRESVFWISLMSIYAVVVSHATAWQAARAEDAAD
jgi:hypothetical protein